MSASPDPSVTTEEALLNGEVAHRDAGSGERFEPPDESRTERRRRETHVKILEAIWYLTVERSDAKLAIADVTAEADVAYATFYNHFPDLDTAIFETIERDIERTAARVGSIATSGLDAVEIWMIHSAVISHRLVRCPRWCRFVVTTYRHPWFPRNADRSMSRALLERGVDEGTMRISDIDIAYRFNEHLRLALSDHIRHRAGPALSLEQAVRELAVPGFAILGVASDRVEPLINWIMPKVEAISWKYPDENPSTPS